MPKSHVFSKLYRGNQTGQGITYLNKQEFELLPILIYVFDYFFNSLDPSNSEGKIYTMCGEIKILNVPHFL